MASHEDHQALLDRHYRLAMIAVEMLGAADAIDESAPDDTAKVMAWERFVERLRDVEEPRT